MGHALSIGVCVSVGLAMLRVLTGLNIFWPVSYTHLRAWATFPRHSFIRAAALVPSSYRDEGLPQPWVIASTAACTAPGRTGVVAALSE